MAKEFQGGRASGGRRGEGWGDKPRRAQRFTPVTLSDEEKTLADALALFARKQSHLAYDHEAHEACERRPVIYISSDDGPGRDEKSAALEAAFTRAGVRFERLRSEDHPERPFNVSRFFAEYRFDPQEMINSLRSEPVQALLGRMRDHEAKESDKSPQDYIASHARIVPLDAAERANLVDLESDCNAILGITRRVGPGGAGNRGGNTNHPGIGQHETGGRE